MGSMKRWIHRAGGVIAAGTVLLTASATAQNVDLILHRMKQDSNTTLVLGTLEMSRPLGRDLPCAYVVEMRVVDQNRTSLLNEAWREERSCPGVQLRTAVTYETLRLGVVPGRYEVTAAMYPEGKAAEKKQKVVTVESLPRGARSSDLILAREVGVIDSTNNARWNVRYDGVGLITSSTVRIAPESPKLAFYLEVYPKASEAMTGKVVGTVRDAEGRQLAQMDLATISGTGTRKRVAGAAAVAGLPPGSYSLDATVQLEDTSFTRTAKFTMDAPAAVAEATATAGYFGRISAEELKQFDALVIWMESKEQRELFRSLGETGRREFLARYFGPNGPTGDSNNRLDLFLERSKRINEKFTERTGRNPTPAWQTDRGRIYMMRGEPAKQLNRPFQPGDAPPYEIWSYDIGQQYVYLFADQSRFGNYRLIFTTDPREPTLPDWQNRVGPSAVDDLRTQFNIRT
jgi:GWxTD domain-containing protein